MTLLEAINDPNLFGRWFRDRENWTAWRVFLCALFGLPLLTSQCDLFRRCTGRQFPLAGGYREAWLVCGRRAGKSFMLALIAVYLACFHNWRPYLGPGERATIVVIAADRKQARVIMRYVKGLLSVPMLARMIIKDQTETIDLTNRVTIEVHTASFRTVRGYTVVAALCDEVAFWRSEDSANPDREIIGALRPAMATMPGAMLLCASSPYARRGALWETYNRHFGMDSPVLVWHASTREMNPTVPQSLIEKALTDDPAHASAEYLAQFRTDVETFVAREIVEACVDPGIRERPPHTQFDYLAFVDPSGGSADSFTLAIAHRENDRVVIDAVRERFPPFSPESVVDDYAALLNAYRITRVTGDRYAGEWPREQFRKRGITYEPAEKPKSDLYRDFLPLLNAGSVTLLDNARLVGQLVGLERRVSRGGRDSIDHAPNAHDDVANAVAGAAALGGRPKDPLMVGGISGYGGCGEISWRSAEADRPVCFFSPPPEWYNDPRLMAASRPRNPITPSWPRSNVRGVKGLY